MTTSFEGEFLVQRLAKLRRRRAALVSQIDRLRGALPEWAAEPLRLVGLSAAEVSELTVPGAETDEHQQELEEARRKLAELQGQIDLLEDTVLASPVVSLDWLHAALDLARDRLSEEADLVGDVERLRSADPRSLALLDGALACLRHMLRSELRLAS